MNAGPGGHSIATRDWSDHPVGPPSNWPISFRTALGMVLNSRFPACIAWGDDLHVFYNQAYEVWFGSRSFKAQGARFDELWPDAWDTLEPLARRALAGEAVYHEDLPFQIERPGLPTQAYFTFSFSPIPAEDSTTKGILVIGVETTDKVNAIARHRESEERLQLSLDASDSIGTWSVEPATGITFLDERFARLFQVDAAQAEGGTALERLTNIIHPDDRQRVVDAVAHAIATRTLYDIAYRIPQKSGRDIWVAARGRMFGPPLFATERFAGIAVDITRQKESELALEREVEVRKRVEQELRQASQRKDEFLAMLAHELRNPLAPIRTAADLLLMHNIEAAQVRKTSAVISRQVRHMTSLVDDLLDVSRVTRGLVTLDLAEVDMARIVADAVEQVRPLIASKHHELSVHLPAESAHVLGDGKRLVQVVGNLLNNAAKYTPAGGSIVVRVQVPREDLVRVSVQDNGIGMSGDFTGRAFELFTQADRTPDRAQGGLGIGLALVRSLTELHRGSVAATSGGPDAGSELTVCLPRLLAQRAQQSQETEATAFPPENPLRVLVVDDNEDAATTLAMFLEMGGHEVMVENGARSGLARALSHAPDVCLLDIGLPEMDGMELARQIRAQPALRHARLVAVTGYGQEQDRNNTAAAGFDHHLVKPVDPVELAKLLAGMQRRLVRGAESAAVAPKH